MDVSRILFTKETKKTMKKPLTITEKGKLRWQRIKDAEASGRISQAKNRYEVGVIAGYGYNHQGYSWTTNMINRGRISETFLGKGKNNKSEYEYHIASEPDFDRQNARNARAAKAVAKQQNASKEPVAKQPNPVSVKDKTESRNNMIEVTIRKNDLVLVFRTAMSVTNMRLLIKDLFDK